MKYNYMLYMNSPFSYKGKFIEGYTAITVLLPDMISKRLVDLIIIEFQIKSSKITLNDKRAFVYLLSEVIQWYKPLLIPFAILSCISIFLLSPIRSTKHPLSERLYAQNKKAARIIVSIDFLLFLILYITGMPTRYLATWALSLSAVAIMMVITLFEKNSTRRESV